MKQDITQHCDDELILLVENDESLYNLKNIGSNYQCLYETIEEMFLYNEIQMENLKDHLTLEE